MPVSVRRALERSFDVDLSPVRVHADPRSAAAADSLGVRAFTHGLHIFLGSGQSPTDLALMAHEVSHVVQQQGAPVLQMYSVSGGDRFEREAEQASATAQRGERAAVAERTGGPRVQGQGLLERGGTWLRDQAIALVEERAPELVPILRQGVVEWLKERLGAALRSMMDDMARPVRTIGDLVAAVRRHFTNLVAWMREAGAKIARNDCSPITEAADKIHQVFDELAAPVIDRVKHYADTVKQFFQGLWDRFGAPVWDLLRRIGGAIWEQIQRVGRWIWEKTQPIRDWLSSAWGAFKNWLGIGEGEEGQNGVLQWFQRKAGEAWEWVSARLAPYKRQMLIAVGILALLSPAGPYIVIAAAVAGLLRGVQWIRQNMRTRGSVVQQRSVLRGVILPAILGAIARASGIVRGFAETITGALARLAGVLGDMASTVSSIPVLSFASGLVQFVVNAFRGLLDWAIEGVHGLATWLDSGLQRLGGLARTLIDFLERVGAAAANVMRLGYALGGRVWNAIPACIRDPVIDFFIPLILRQISFFSELVASPEAWRQTRTEVMGLIRQVFRDFDLMGAIRSAFRLVVRALRIPVDLALQVLERGAQAWDVVVAAPLRFIENSLKAILRGFGRFMSNFLSHLWYGVQGWLLNAIEQSGTGIRPPATWDFRGIFGFVLDVLGISLDHVLELLARRVGRPIVDRIRRAITFLTGVWEWVKVAIEEGPAGLWRMVVDRLGNLARTVLESAVSWVMTRIIAVVSARLTALAASAGLSAVLEAVVAVYQAIRTAIEYARRILEIMLTVFNTVVQIAQGVIEPAAEMLERGLRMAMPIVIGFLANYAGLGGIGTRIREIVLAVRERVDTAILWLIDRALAAGRWLLDRLRAGLAAVRRWFRIEKPVTLKSGESHTLYVEESAASNRLFIRTAPQPFVAWVNTNFGPKPGGVPAHVMHAQLLAQAQIIETLQTSYAAATTDTQRISISNNISAAVNQLAALLEQVTAPAGTVPPTVFRYGGVDAMGFGLRASATFLSRDHIQGQPATVMGAGEYVAGWDLARSRTRIGRNDPVGYAAVLDQVTPRILPDYVRGHLMNGILGGPAFPYNLTPIRGDMNNNGQLNSHFRRVEEPLQQAVRIAPPAPPRVFNYEVVAQYRGHPRRTGLHEHYQSAFIFAQDARIKEQRKLDGIPPGQTAVRQQVQGRIDSMRRAEIENLYAIDFLDHEERNLVTSFECIVQELRPSASTPSVWEPSTAAGTLTIIEEIEHRLPSDRTPIQLRSVASLSYLQSIVS